MGVFNPCSCLMTAERHADRGVSTISDGNEAVFGVWRGGSTGFLIAEGILSTTTSESKTQPEAKSSDNDDDLSNLQRRRKGEPRREKPGSGRGWLYYFWEGDTMQCTTTLSGMRPAQQTGCVRMSVVAAKLLTGEVGA